MQLSPAERSYLYDSLVLPSPIRPDARKPFQFRPLEAKTSFLEGSNGSARLRMLDGCECIVSIKSKVVRTDLEPSLLECDVDIQNQRDDSNYVMTLKYNLTNLLVKNFPVECLRLTKKYSFKLYIDCIVISPSSYPLSILSFAIYLALKTARFPLLISETDDEAIEEQPTFSDDWEDARLLQEMANESFHVPIIITLGVVGKNVLFDPSIEEEQVLENGLLATFCENQAMPPFENFNLASNSNKNYYKGLNVSLVITAVKMMNDYCQFIIKALDNLIDHDDDGRLF